MWNGKRECIMNLLAASAGRGSMITILVLCICVLIFIITDVALVISLHRQNKKLAKKAELTAPDDSDTKL